MEEAYTKPQTNGASSRKVPSKGVVAVSVPPEEVASRKPSHATTGAAVSILQRDGIVLIKNVVSHEAIDTINAILTKEAEELAADPGTHFNFDPNARNISQVPPMTPDLMFDDIWANPFTASVLSSVLGPNPECHYVNGNTALKSTGRQDVHADLAFNHLQFPFGIVANYYLCDTDATNGSTEVWIGSHRETTIDDHTAGPGSSTIKPELLEARRKTHPPVQPAIQKGDLVLRDVRLWHAGMPNSTDTPRIMLAFNHFPWWYMNGVRLTFPLKTKPLLERWARETGIVYAADYVDEDIDHRKVKFVVGSRSTNPAVVYG